MKAAIVNIGKIVTGHLEYPLAYAECLVMENGRITHIGSQGVDLSECQIIVDADQATVIPGLIDSHIHVVLGDYTPRQESIGFLESYTHGGITTSISAGEVHVPGRPKDPAGVKALALMSQRCFEKFRPGGMKVHAGSLLIEPGLVEADFQELRKQGVWLAKAGFGAFEQPTDATELIRMAQKHGFIVMCHTGGASIPGSFPVNAEEIIEMRPDVSGHINGGPIALSDTDVERIIHETEMGLQIVQAGNFRSALKTVELAIEAKQLHRLLLGSDTPAGVGVMPLAIMKTIVELASLSEASPEQLIAAASGNIDNIYNLKTGLVQEGYQADLLIIDAPYGGQASDALEAMKIGDLPAISGCFIDGQLRYMKSRNAPPAIKRNIKVVQEKLSTWM